MKNLIWLRFESDENECNSRADCWILKIRTSFKSFTIWKKNYSIENGSFVRQPHNFGHTIFIFPDWMDIFCQEIVQRLRTTTSHGADNFLRQFYIILYNVWAHHIWDFWYTGTKFKIFSLVFEPLHDAFYGHHHDSLVFKVKYFIVDLHSILRKLLCILD